MPTTTKPKRTRKAQPTSLPRPDHRAILAARLDRLADFHLHLGFHGAAEQLARRAAEMRGAA